MRHVTHMNASCHTDECAMSHTWMRHVIHMNTACHTYECFMSHIWMRHVTHMNASRHTYEYTWLRMRHVTHINVSWHTHTSCHAYKQVVYTYASCHTHACVILLFIGSPYTSHHTCKRVTSLVLTSHVTNMNGSCHTHEWVMSHVWMGHGTHIWWVSHVTHMTNASWQT